MKQETILCPSHHCKPGTVLLGIVMPDGRVAYSSDKIVVTDEFVDIASQGRSPEKRFRFAGKCIKSGCKQWDTDRCGVIDSVLEFAPAINGEFELPECSIRPQCRWFQQNGAKACQICPEVVTDAREP